MHEPPFDALVQHVRQQTDQLLAQLDVDPALAAPLHQALTALEQAVRSPQAPPVDAAPHHRPGPSLAPADHAPRAIDADLLAQALWHAPVGLCLLAGPEQRYTFTNQRYDQMVNRTGIIGQTVWEAFPEITGQGIDALLDHVYTTGAALIVPERVLHVDRRGDGVVEDVYFDLHCFPLRDEDGGVIGITTYVADVSDRVALEHERRRVAQLTQTALEAAEAEQQRLLTVLHAVPAAISLHMGPEHIYTFTNTVYDQIVRRDVLGKSIREAFPDLAGYGFYELYDQVYTTGIPFVGRELPVTLHAADGTASSIYANVTYVPIRDAAGTITGIFEHSIDVTELVVARQAAEAAVELRDQFLSIAAHELRTPLAALIGYSGLFQRRMQRAGSLDVRTGEILTLLDAQGQRLSRLIDTLLDVARINSGRLSLDRAPLDLGALVQQVVEEARVSAAGRTISVALPPAACMVLGDRLRLEQVMVNLVQNALKYSPGGGAVTVSVGCAGGQVQVQVRDQGMGMPAAALPHLFERFYRVTHGTTAALPGLGLGLAVVHEIVTLHGGTITVESTEGVGSTFTVTLPLVDATPTGLL